MALAHNLAVETKVQQGGAKVSDYLEQVVAICMDGHFSALMVDDGAATD